MTVRQEVLEQLVDTIRDAQDRGLGDGMKAAADAFPGTPLGVIAEAWAELDSRRTEDWWQTVERTIDGEIVRSALLKSGGGA